MFEHTLDTRHCIGRCTQLQGISQGQGVEDRQGASCWGAVRGRLMGDSEEEQAVGDNRGQAVEGQSGTSSPAKRQADVALSLMSS